MSALDVSLSPAEAAAAAGPCPPWCEIEDHDDYGRVDHSTWTNVEVSAYDDDVLMVARQQFPGRAPVIVITLPGYYCAQGDKLFLDPDGHISFPYDQALLTFAEAQETAISLLVMSGASTGSPHFACEPSDPSPCCPDSPLRASAYPAAVFCPGCGSLYWRAEVPAGEPASPPAAGQCPPWCGDGRDGAHDGPHLSEAATVAPASPRHRCGYTTAPAPFAAEECDVPVSAQLVTDDGGRVTVELYHGDDLLPALAPAAAGDLAAGIRALLASAADAPSGG